MTSAATRRRVGHAAATVLFLALFTHALPAAAQELVREPAYRAFPLIGSRLAVWAVAQLHLNFAAFILGVPVFAVIIEIIGRGTRRPQDQLLSPQVLETPFAPLFPTPLL